MFSQTGREVHNVIDAAFTFEDGKIRTHMDRFGFWRWAGMAFGVPGTLFGWLPPLQGAVRKKARAGLDAFIAKRVKAG